MRTLIFMLWCCICLLGMTQEAHADTTIGSTFEQENSAENCNAPAGTITASATNVTSATAVKLIANATDEDGDSIFYAWHATEGAFTTATTNFKTVYWQAPTVQSTTTIQITLTIGDGRGKMDATGTTITVNPVVVQPVLNPDYVLQECMIDGKTANITLYQGQGNVSTGCFIVNQGAGAATRSSYTYFTVNGTRYGNHYVIALEPGESSYEAPNLDVDVLAAGQYTLSVQADATSRVTETNESNNTATLSFTVLDSSTFPDGTLVQGVDNTVYMLDGGFKRAIGTTTDAIFEACGFTEEEVIVLGNSRLDEWPQGENYPQLADQVLIIGPNGGAVYILQEDEKRGIVSGEVFAASQFDWGAIIWEPYQRIIDALPDGQNYPQLADQVLITGPNGGTVYILEAHLKRGIVSGEVFAASQFDWNTIIWEESQAIVDAIPEWWTYPQLFDEVLITGPNGGTVYILEAHLKRGIVSAEVFNAAGFDWNAIIWEENQGIVNAVPTGTPFTGH